MATQGREYDVVILGATGYTGKFAVQHLIKNGPPDLKWAIAGRSLRKLEDVIAELKPANKPAIETCDLSPDALERLAKKTRVLVTTVGPYIALGEPVLAACANNGTHYVDCTGETPWVLDMIHKYHDIAKSTGAKLIPQCGFESLPADLSAFLLVNKIREELGSGTKEVAMAIHKISGGVSGGTAASALNIFKYASVSQMIAASKPWAFSPVPGNPNAGSQVSAITGARYVPDLGTLVPNVTSETNRAQVHRSWGLIGPSAYGSSFTYFEYLQVRNVFRGMLFRTTLTLLTICLLIPPFRWLAGKFVYAQGQGPPANEKFGFIYRGIGLPEDSSSKKKALISHSYRGNIYDFTGLIIVDAALSLLEDSEKDASVVPANKLGGGVLTPATLGLPFVERLRKSGVVFDTKIISA